MPQWYEYLTDEERAEVEEIDRRRQADVERRKTLHNRAKSRWFRKEGKS